ncbi:MAG: hypothetical protein GWN39_19795, partial [Thermoplasmata archaeon]|nr:hypothetical protein [Thermoplasmata archaeon]NIS14380.1 hypothetical protein [Thermoplasmata archaeon]NIS22207.1 hypothetical protein [Thermoplasmata archaeon]NIT80105.1 hypothetical protein [Thermoplasmata archaeon]NIV80929.1 hypothetical protein [Thermoplasmata archaeon]
TDSNQEISLTVNNLVQGQLGAPDVGAAVGASRTLVLRNQDSGVDETNELVFARGWDVGAGLAATPYGYDLGSVWGYAWDGTDYVRQAGITFKISSDTASGRTGTMTASDGYGAIQFRHHEGVNDAYEVSASAMADLDLDWEFYDDVFIGQPGGVLGFGSNTETLATCIVDDGADEIFGDRDCDDTVDTAENPLDTYFLEVADGAGATSSFSGLEIGGTDWNDLALLQGCADTEVLSWNDGSNIWECTATSSFGLSDHGALTGLSDDDHALYLDTTAADTFSATNWYTTSDTADGFDTNVLGLSGGGAMADNRGAQLYLYGDDRSITPGWAALEGGTNGNVEVRNNCSTCNLVLDSASDDINMLTTNVDLRLETDGVDFNIPANQLIQF